jgi:amino acid adenylation domain-containing protein
MWSDLLGIEEVGVKANFFDLGGNSLLGATFINRLKRKLGEGVNLINLFEKPTIHSLSRYLEEHHPDGVTRLLGEVETEARKHGFVIQPVPRDGNLPLSYAQQRLWFMDQLEPGGFTYNMPNFFRMTGKIDLESFRKSLEKVIERHEVLRTRFPVVEGKPVQEIMEPYRLKMPVIDLTGKEGGEREAEARRLATEEATKPFDLGRGPLMRVKLLKLGEEEHIVLLTLHHIVADAWSIGVLVREFAALYEYYVRGEEAELADLEVQYVDYAVWQRERLVGEELERQVGYWREALTPMPPVLELPADHERPRVATYRGQKQRIEIKKEMAERVRGLSRETGTTEFMVLLGVYMMLLGRYSGEEDIAVGVPTANRGVVETEGLIGFFVNMLAMRGELSGDPSFRELLERIKGMALGAYEHQELPFEMVVETLQPERDASRNPIFQVAFQYQNAEVGELRLTGLRMEEMDSDFGAARLDLMLSMADGGDGTIRGSLQYNTDLYEAGTIERIGVHYMKLLEGVLADPEMRISEVGMMGEEEMNEQLVKWNETGAAYPGEEGLMRLIEAQVERTPDREALKLEGEVLSYQELNERANQVGRYLVGRGVRANKVVGLCVERSIETIVGMLGIMKAGGVFLPLDPNYPQERITYMLGDAGAEHVVAEEKVLGVLAGYEGELILLDGQREEIEAYSGENLDVEVDGEDLAYIVYTSGTTGAPKGVMVRQRNLRHNTLGVIDQFQLQEGDRMMQFVSITFDPSFEEILPVLITGGTIVMAKNPAELVGSSLLEFVEKEEINNLHMAASVFHQTVLEMERLDLSVPACVKFYLVGAETLELERLRAWSKRVVKPMRFINAYGPTENSCSATGYEMIVHPEADLPEHRVPIGKPIANVRIYLLDKNQRPVPVGVPGEIYIGGEKVAAGYLNMPEATKAVFLPDPYSNKPGAAMYRTGDLARYLPDGNLDFLGRLDEQIKLRGYRIELGEIEAALKAHPKVNDAVVILREDIPEVKQLVAYLVGDPVEQPESIQEYLAINLPSFMIPGAIMWLDEFPVIAHGKVDRNRLPIPDFRKDVVFEIPESPLENRLAEMWTALLGSDPISLHSNFFDLGGNSLLAATLINRLKSELGEDIKLVVLFEKPTVYQLSRYLEEHHPLGVRRLLGEVIPGDEEALLRIKPVSRKGNLPLSFAQQRLWFMDRLQPGGYTYNVPNFFRLAGELDLPAFKKSLETVIERHEVLRTRFLEVDGRPVQVVGPPYDMDITVVDLTALPTDQR